MPFYIQELMQEDREIITATREQSVAEALRLMNRKDFSQLPVVDENNRPEGMITYESILQAVDNLNTTIPYLKVSHAMTGKMRVWRQDNDLFDILEDLKTMNAVLLVDNDGRLTGIITNYDTTEYFRQRSEDMMLVQDIEDSLKEHVRQAFSSDNEFDEEAVQEAIAQIQAAKGPDKGQFFKALTRYVTLTDGEQSKVDNGAAEQAFEVLQGEINSRPFEQLTFNDYMQLLFHKEKWGRYRSTFRLEKNALLALLEDVRDTRNGLAHFRDIDPEQRQQLQYCVKLFEQHPAVVQEPEIRKYSLDIDEVEVPMIELEPRESRYTLLAKYLERLSRDRERVRLTLDQIGEIVQHKLPPSAETHRSWWANDSVGHTQSKLWLAAGWQVENINLQDERITFGRIEK